MKVTTYQDVIRNEIIVQVNEDARVVSEYEVPVPDDRLEFRIPISLVRHDPRSHQVLDFITKKVKAHAAVKNWPDEKRTDALHALGVHFYGFRHRFSSNRSPDNDPIREIEPPSEEEKALQELGLKTIYDGVEPSPSQTSGR